MVYQMVYQDDCLRKQNTPHPGSTRLACLLGVLLLALPFPVQAQGILENPVAGEAASGIGNISGWFRDAQTIIVVFDSLPPLAAAYGTSRTDTLSDCGDTNNGFGLLFNFSVLGDGPHTVRVLADGVQFGSTASTVVTFETEFLEGAPCGCCRSGCSNGQARHSDLLSSHHTAPQLPLPCVHAGLCASPGAP